MSTRTLYATLIGINAYEKINPLRGCIRDILHIDNLLRGLCASQVPAINYKPLYLLAPHAAEQATIQAHFSAHGADGDYLSPRFDHITQNGFDHLSNAKGNDICLLYFSGHGSYIPAPEVFWGSKGVKQNETLLAVDSRAGARAIIDKELAYLLHKTLDGKPEVHCLLIMDCCHSGDNTRAVAEEEEPVYRQADADPVALQLKDYLGYNEGFYTISNGRASFPIARYVQMASCRDHEKAADHPSGGMFSRALHELLATGGTAMTYRQLQQNLAATISLKNGNQNPVFYARDNSDLDRPFLGGDIKPYQHGYEVRFLGDGTGWHLMAGSLHGLVPSGPLGKTLVSVEGVNGLIEVIHVESGRSGLGPDADGLLDRTKTYRARLVKLAIPKTVIGVHPFLAGKQNYLSGLQKAFNEVSPVYFELIPDHPSPDYRVGLAGNDDDLFYALTLSNSFTPLFKVRKDPAVFLQDTEGVCKWRHVKTLHATNPVYSADDFVFEAEVLEGKEFNKNVLSKIDLYEGESLVVHTGDNIVLRYVDGKKPAIRFSVRIKDESKVQSCYVQALYFDSQFGIDPDNVEPSANRLEKGSRLHLKMMVNNMQFNTIPLQIPGYKEGIGAGQIFDQLKIIISERPGFNAEAYRQESLPLEEKFRVMDNMRGIARIDDEDEGQPADDWAAFDFTLNIKSDKAERKLTGGAAVDLDAFSIQAPAGFESLATIVTREDMAVKTRDAEVIAEPFDLWDDVWTDASAFDDTSGKEGRNGVVAIEISVEENKPFPVLMDGNELVLTPKAGIGATRSMDAMEETIVPYAFDAESGFYFPVGYADSDGNIHITRLPAPTPGSLTPKAISTRSLAGSVKLYFKKIFRRPVTALTLHFFDGEWDHTTDTNRIRSFIQGLPGQSILPLVIHGIIGDTRSMVKGLQMHNDLHLKIPCMLSFDYENLGTKIPDTAKKLKQSLEAVGFPNDDLPKLTIVAHSMGGLLSRWMIEQEKFTAPIKQLIMVGTPNGGSEWSDAITGIKDGASFLLSHALNITGPLKYVITGVSFFIKKLDDPLSTLRDMDHTGELIEKLSGSRPPAGIPYSLVGSDTALLRNGYDGDDPFLKKAVAWLRDGLILPGLSKTLFKGEPNDMAVTVSNMTRVPGFDAGHQAVILPGDHISYFTEQTTRDMIIQKVMSSG